MKAEQSGRAAVPTTHHMAQQTVGALWAQTQQPAREAAVSHERLHSDIVKVSGHCDRMYL